jgi:hypothetical protein
LTVWAAGRRHPARRHPERLDDTSETFQDLEPGTYNCTVVVDP